MKGNVASPVMVNGPDDNVLVGDTVQVTAPPEQDSSVTPEVQVDTEAVVKKLKVTPELAPEAAEEKSWFSPKAITEAVNNIPKDDKKAGIDLAKRLQKGGKLELADAETLDKLIKSTGLDERIKASVSNFDLSDYSPDIKLEMFENIDWDTDFDFDFDLPDFDWGGESGMFDGLKDMWPDVDMGEWTDDWSLDFFEDISFKQALKDNADWIDADFLDSVDMSKWTDKGVDYLKDMTKDIKSEKHADWLMKLTEKLTPELMEVINPMMVPTILKIYPWGFNASYKKGGEEAYQALTAKLTSIDPDWYLIARNGVMVNNLEPYFKASQEALHVLSFHDPHQTNVTIVGSYVLKPIEVLDEGKVAKDAVAVKPKVAEKTDEVVSTNTKQPHKEPTTVSDSVYDEIMADGKVSPEEFEKWRAWNLGKA